MRNFIIVILAVILLAGIGGGAFAYDRLNREVNQARRDIQNLQINVASMAVQSQATVNVSMSMVDLITMIQPVIVRVDAPNSISLVSGSGVIIRSDGYVITNSHVIARAADIIITLSDGRQFNAGVIGADDNLDLAILKIADSPANLQTAILGTTSDIVIGGVVVAGGFPLGTSLPGPASFTQGIVSAVRTINGKRYIQSDVDINPGNSGGALVARTSGRLIGVTSAGIILPTRNQDIEGIGLAIPIDIVSSFIQANLK